MRRFTVPVRITAAVLFTAGCAIPYSDPGGRVTLNRCSTNEECGPDAACRDERCTGTQVDLTGMILEARPNSGASFGASTSFLVTPATPSRSAPRTPPATPSPSTPSSPCPSPSPRARSTSSTR